MMLRRACPTRQIGRALSISILSMIAIATMACIPATSDPTRPVFYSPQTDEIVLMGTVEPDLPVPELTPNLPANEREFALPAPTSEHAETGTWYAYVTAHCGLWSPIDFDGSYWIPHATSIDPNAEAVNSTPGRIRLVDAQTLEFRTSTGFVAHLRRHDKATWFWMCM